MFRRRKLQDFFAEIDAHLRLEEEDLVRGGVPRDTAREAARRAFGSVVSAREHYYEAHRWLLLDHLWQDLRAGARNLVRYPVAGIVAVLSLAGGIGATTATVTIRDVVFRRPPPLYADSRHLSRVQ